ncbi:MAG: penicillin-binding transpeptidase domain-containing protein [candidate division WOR-3 bacterium]
MKKDTTYRRLDLIGRSGIEREYETWLRGRDGYEYAEVDARGHEIGPLPEKRPEPPTPGKDIYLTIDDRLQELACELVAPFERAAVVGLEVKTGAVLCLVSRPEFDPNVFIGPVDPVAWEALVSNPSKPFFNRVIASCYPPGSVLKPIVALAALHSRVVRPATTLDPCTGQFRYGNRVFKCWSAHGWRRLLTPVTAISTSLG